MNKLVFKKLISKLQSISDYLEFNHLECAIIRNEFSDFLFKVPKPRKNASKKATDNTIAQRKKALYLQNHSSTNN